MNTKGYLSDDVKIVNAVTVTNGAAGTSDITGVTIDTQGFDGICFVIPVGAVVSAAVTTAKVQSGDDSGLSDAADLLGTSLVIADDDDDQIKFLDVTNIAERYCRIVIPRATQNATVGGVIAVLYKARSVPVTQPSGTEGEQHNSPGEGTA